METEAALACLTALGHATRLEVFRRIVAAGPEGTHPGALASQLDMRPNTLSNALGILARAGLIEAHREGRSIRYTSRLETLQRLVGFLVDDCCGGRPEFCRPVLDELARKVGATPHRN